MSSQFKLHSFPKNTKVISSVVVPSVQEFVKYRYYLMPTVFVKLLGYCICGKFQL